MLTPLLEDVAGKTGTGDEIRRLSTRIELPALKLTAIFISDLQLFEPIISGATCGKYWQIWTCFFADPEFLGSTERAREKQPTELRQLFQPNRNRT
jgi:hypothetical protein